MRIRRALISVSDKRGLAELAQCLQRLGVEILSTGGTARALAAAGVPVTEVSAYTGAPEIMGGRVKTLHPRVHGGILARRGEDDAVMAEHGIEPIDLVVVNLYPFEDTVATPGCSVEQAVEQIDIGGPAMIRAAAKNHRWVTVVVDPDEYPRLIAELERSDAAVDDGYRRRLAAQAFAHTAAYDAAITRYLWASLEEAEPLPPRLVVASGAREDMRYGENPHQRAAFYRDRHPSPGTVGAARVLQGKALSFNNINDTDAALACVQAFERPACVIVKHANPCGVAEAAGIAEAYEHAWATDPTSAFGGIIAFNRPLDEATARTIIERQFVEVVAAPSVTPAALEALAAKPNVRVLETGEPAAAATGAALDVRTVGGGLLVQEPDLGTVGPQALRVVTRRAPDPAEREALYFAWRVAKYVKSNAIVYASGTRTLGIGAGQMSRVDSARIGAQKAADAGLSLVGSVMASDAFFPFRDGIDAAARHGVTAVIQPGGSVRDDEVIAAADEHGMAMVFTGMRHFRH